MMSNDDDLCEELILEIFSRLPTKSLLRFRSVSKSLCARIGSPGFIRLHTLQSPQKVIMIHRLLLHYEGVKNIFTRGQLPYNCIPSHFRGSGNNGILCVDEKGDLHLWCTWGRGFYDRIYDAAGGVFGFGFDPIIQDYKVLRMSKQGSCSFVYTMKTHTWRQIASPTTPTNFTFVKYYQCLFNGALHWLVKTTTDSCHYYIMTFDLSREVFSTIELPEPTWKITHVTVVKGCLAVISSSEHNNDYSRVWVRKEYYNNTWFPAYQMAADPLQALRVLPITPNDDELLYIVYESEILVYSLRTRTLYRLVDFRRYYSIGVDVCLESFGMLEMRTNSCETFHVSFSKMFPA